MKSKKVAPKKQTKKTAPKKTAPKKTAPKKTVAPKKVAPKKAKIEVIKPTISKVVAKKAPNLATKLGLFDNCVKKNGRIFLKPPREFADFPDLLSLQKK
jgi:hypothetical protein